MPNKTKLPIMAMHAVGLEALPGVFVCYAARCMPLLMLRMDVSFFFKIGPVTTRS